MKKWIIAIMAAIAVAIPALALLITLLLAKNDEYAVVEDIADSFPIAAEAMDENPQFAHSDGPYAIIHTTAGDVTVLLYPDQAPKAVENFVGLAKEGYYDGSSFYYAKRDELVQGGRPAEFERYIESEQAAQGELAPEEIIERSFFGEPFEDEFHDDLHHFPGAVAMAGGVEGMDRNLSQFYFLISEKKEENELVIPANLYMNELIRMRSKELNARNKEKQMSEDEVAKFEEELNAEIQKIGTEGVPEEYMERYKAAIEQYNRLGGSWSLDYKYTVFGQIVKGYNVAKAMSQVKVDATTRKPKKPILIEGIEIVDTLQE